MLLQALVFATLPLQLALASPAPAQSSGAVGDILNGLLGDPEGYGFADLGGDVEVMSLIRGVKNALSGDTSLCHAACNILPLLAPSSPVSSSSSSSYTPLQFWSVQQSSLTPSCRIDITSAHDLSAALKTSKLFRCPFAVKSGGHAAFAGASSIQGGILVNLGPLNEVVLSEDRKTTRVGPGNTWGDVYNVLDPLGVAVVGGRESGVGVGGLLLGGGISYFSGSLGWACDNVKNYQVVLANGNIVDANPNSNRDLYWALRGGSGVNFGLVSRFDLYTFEQGNLWGGSRFYPMQLNTSLANMYSNFVNNAPSDPKAHLYIAFVYAAQLGGFAATTGPAYSDPISNAPIFNELNAIPSLLDATGVMSMGALAVALNQTTYSRETFKTVTFKNDPTLIQSAIEIFVEEASALLDVPGFLPAFAFQPLSLNIIENMQKNGGNVLGLSTADGPLTIMNLNWGWSNAADDTRVFDAVNRFVSRCTDLGASMGVNNRFIYMNYAAQDQDVFAGYGPESVSRLKRVQSEYDPTGVFRNLQPGYFKL